MTQKEKMNRAFILLAIITVLLGAIILLIPKFGKPQRYLTGKPEATDLPAEAAPRGTPEKKVKVTPRREAENTPEGEPRRTPEPVEFKGMLAFVIDDAGNSLGDLEPFLASASPLTIAVLPGLAYSTESADLVTRSGKELILHLPMEAESGYDPGPGAVLTELSDTEIRTIIETNFKTVPGARGANNHMGSKATSDPRVMDIVIEYLNHLGKYFMDSRTTKNTVVHEYARKYGIPYAERDVFLDNKTDKVYIKGQIQQGMKIAEKQGSAILIGHTQNIEVIEVINEYLPQIEREGFELVLLSELIH